MDAVQMVGITKQFGPLIANNKVDFELKKGEVHALLGENGAGKTTLMRILYGLYKADSGEIRVEWKTRADQLPQRCHRQRNRDGFAALHPVFPR